MTFCLGMRVQEGLVGIADTRVTSGSECIVARKLSPYKLEEGVFFIMSSGLRSVRDKALTYFGEVVDQREEPLDRLFKVVNTFADQIRRVAAEDKESLERGGTSFSANALIGGQCRNDPVHKLYQVYAEANWVEIGPGTPYHIIGARGYGKPVLDRTLKFEDSLEFALRVGCLAFDSTRISAADVGLPIDVVAYRKDSFQLLEHRFEEADFRELSEYWQDRLRRSINNIPSDWVHQILPGTEAPKAEPDDQLAARDDG